MPTKPTAKIFVCKDCGDRKELPAKEKDIFHNPVCLTCDKKMYTAN